MKRHLFLLLTIICCSISAIADNPFVGWWRGEVTSLPIVFKVYENTDGTYDGLLFSPAQTADSIPLSAVSVNGDTLMIEVTPLMASFKGVLSHETQPKITGQFIQGRTFSMTLYPADEKDARVYRPQNPVPPYMYSATDVTFPSGSLTMAGTLTSPWTKPNGGIILVSGSGAQNRDEEIQRHKPFAVIADFLTRCGWAVLRYDDRGVGGSSKGTTFDTTFDFAADAMAAVSYMRQHFPGLPVGILGHSEGGTIAMIDAAEHPDSIDFIISLAGMATKGKDLMIRQNEMISDLYGQKMTDDDKALFVSMMDAIDMPGTDFQVASRLDSILSVKIPDAKDRLRAVAPMASAWYIQFIRLDPAGYLSKIKCPMLAIGGTWDVQVDATRNLPIIEKCVPTATVKTYPGLNHMFQESASRQSSFSYGAIQQTIAPQVLDDIADFLTSLLRK